VRIGDEHELVTETRFNLISPQITSLSSGGYVVIWPGLDVENYDAIYGQRFDNSGNTVGNEFQVNTQFNGRQRFPSVSALDDGGFVVVWDTQEPWVHDTEIFLGSYVHGQIFDELGAPRGVEFRVEPFTGLSFADTNQRDPLVTGLSNGGFVVGWWGIGPDGDAEVYARLFDIDGAEIGTAILANSNIDNTQRLSSITGLSNGGFVITWDSGNQDGDNTGVFGQAFDPNGAKIGAEFQANTFTVGAQELSSVQALADGGFLVVWQSFRQGGAVADMDIYAQRYSSDGATFGAELLINTNTNLRQDNAKVTSLDDGGFVVVWQSFQQDGSAYGIFARRFDADGIPISDEFQVNSYTVNNQEMPGISALLNGGFVISWVSTREGEDWRSIFTEVFTDDAKPVGRISIDGKLFIGNTITANLETVVDPYGIGDASFQWYRDGELLIGEIGSSYQMTNVDFGGSIRVVARYISVAGFYERVRSSDTLTIAEFNSEPIGSSYFKGSFDYGTEIRANTSTVNDADQLGDFSYQWFRDGTAIPNAIHKNFVLSGSDFGNSLTVEITYQDGRGTTETIYSTAYTLRYSGSFSAIGTSQSDTIWGSRFGNLIEGRRGNDTINGGKGKDQLFGNQGDDILSGGRGRDRLIGGSGDDTLTGGNGRDVFVFNRYSENDVITDFQNDEDRLRILNSANTFADLRIIQDDSSVIITFESMQIRIENISTADLEASDFIF
jgi:Ca2+-binding RTX toxin-like protein